MPEEMEKKEEGETGKRKEMTKCDLRKRDEEDKERMKFSRNLGGP